MTVSRRIFWNIVATYGRSLYALVIGLFTARWVLMALGKSDFGLMGLIGGLAGVVTFLNNLLASAVGRFYAYHVGAAQRPGASDAGLLACRQWFNTALVVHTVLPMLLCAVGYPLGIWAIDRFLAIPPDRIAAACWVWRFTCLAALVGMMNVPFSALYTARQEIAELTVYSFITTTLNAGFIYYMVSHPGFWLTRYAAWTALTAVVPALVIAVRAVFKYPECRLVGRFLWSVDRFRQLGIFACAKFWSDFSGVFSVQGQSILVNKFMGVVYNAAMTVGNSVAFHALTLSSALDGAFSPAITNAIGAGDWETTRRLAFRAMRLSSVLVLLFAVPLLLEVDNVLALWLVSPPDFAAVICVVVLVCEVFERLTGAYAIVIYGSGRGVMRYAWSVGWAGICMVLVAGLFFVLGYGMWSIVIGLVCSKCITCGVRLWLGRILVKFSFVQWFGHVAVPVLAVMVLTFAVGLGPRLLMPASLGRVLVTVLVCEAVFLPLVGRFVLDAAERRQLADVFFACVKGVSGKGAA